MYLTIKEAAERVGVSPQSVHNWIKWGILKGYQLYRNPDSQRPGKILVKEEDLENAQYLGRIV